MDAKGIPRFEGLRRLYELFRGNGILLLEHNNILTSAITFARLRLIEPAQIVDKLHERGNLFSPNLIFPDPVISRPMSKILQEIWPPKSRGPSELRESNTY